MADENTNVDNSQVDGGQVDGSQDGGDVDITKQTDSEFMEDTLDFIKDAKKVAAGEDTSDDGDSSTDEGGSGVLPDLAGTDIPDVYSEAAEAAGMSVSDIIDYANKHTDEELIEEAQVIRNKLKELDDAEAALKNKTDDKVVKQDDKTGKDDDKENKDIDPKLIESITEKISKQLEEKFGATLEEIDKFKAHQEEQSNKQAVDRASKIFDEASKEFPVFGKTDELPRFPSGRLKGQLIPTSPEVKARLEVLRYAKAFSKDGADIDDAMANALATYKGLHLAKELERKQIRDLKNHETKLSGARVGRETKKKYADTREEILDDIRQMKKAAGVE